MDTSQFHDLRCGSQTSRQHLCLHTVGFIESLCLEAQLLSFVVVNEPVKFQHPLFSPRAQIPNVPSFKMHFQLIDIWGDVMASYFSSERSLLNCEKGRG